MKFNFVAKIDANSMDAKIPFIRTINTAKANGYSMNLIAIAEQNNRAFMEMPGFKNDPIKTLDTEKNKIEISWNDRFDEEVIKSVADYKKNVIVLNGERHEFISEYDFIEFVRDHIDEIKGKEFTVTGRVTKNEYNGKISDRFQIQNIFEVTEEKKHKLRVFGEFYFDADSIDTADWKSEKKITFNGYTKEYMSKEHPAAYVPKTITLDASKIDFDNENLVALLNYNLKQMGLSYEDGKIKNNLKKNAYFCQSVILSYVNGAERKEFNESMLTENQKEAVALGLKTIDDFRPAGSIYGDRVVMLKLIDFDGRDKFSKGYIKCDETPKEFEENIYASVKEETVDDFEKSMNKPVEEKKEKSEIEDDDLFS